MLFERWNKSQRTEDKWDKGKLGRSVMLDGSLDLCVGLRFYPAFVVRMLIFSTAKLKSPSGWRRARPTKAVNNAREGCRSAGSAYA
jgi:hypothetical protein